MTQTLERMSDFHDPSPPPPRPPRPADGRPGSQPAVDFDALPALYRDAKLTFEGESRELLRNPATLSKISVAGPDGKQQAARSQLQGDTLAVWHPQDAVAQRIAWGGVTLDRVEEGKQPGFDLTR